ncbi:RNA 2'-phosphotransferase [Pelagicoccus sp. NFK12]|uniref:Probable RNA 2'-phosphotransferase n=1 Tax=Pelagicoccus enzymogenes TaxID=2773457 RepID=A0A927FAS9_9BACT|nr:RNA 2'-phosphotransferase [Pelagicoccus enzymogenes]MBD5780970.1 RNA 2'-phosphotransferase [Pelagicoccus enzymogenes]
MRKELKPKSKFLSLVLRHKPAAAGVTLDENGWCQVHDLLRGAESAGVSISLPELEEIVATNEKKRFSLCGDGIKIRANQGHSIELELGLTEKEPPEELFHGTTIRFDEPIMENGLMKMKRHHVHLSSDIETAKSVGMRHGKVLILRVDSESMGKDGYKFYLSENGVWLVDHVPIKYLKKMNLR